jgi:signal transduction histidine kinase
MNNIIRHSEATRMEIKLQEDAENLTLLIADNGKGFDTENYKKGRGLSNINSRANIFNGRLDIDAAKGQGCRIAITIPLNTGQDLI